MSQNFFTLTTLKFSSLVRNKKKSKSGENKQKPYKNSDKHLRYIKNS